MRNNPDISYRLGIMLVAVKAEIAEQPTIERCREARDIRRQMQEA